MTRIEDIDFGGLFHFIIISCMYYNYSTYYVYISGFLNSTIHNSVHSTFFRGEKKLGIHVGGGTCIKNMKI